MRSFLPEGCPRVEGVSITLEELEAVGMGLRIEGGSFALRGEAASGSAESQEHQKEMALMEREIELLSSRLEYLNRRMAAQMGKERAALSLEEG